VTNTGELAGREVVQAYVSVPGSAVDRAPRELKAFRSVEIQPGETVTVDLLARARDLRYWEERVEGWILETGDYVVEVGSSSRELHASATVTVPGDELVIPVTRDSSVGDAFAHPVAGPIARAEISASPFGAIMMTEGELNPMGKDMPLSRLVSFGVPAELVTRILEAGK
jgi:beta-glucosidase